MRKTTRRRGAGVRRLGAEARHARSEAGSAVNPLLNAAVFVFSFGFTQNELPGMLIQMHMDESVKF